ncbi:MAG: hypothetical protein NTY36_02035 [Deltaproteobacteria bacterium]|nr:hypothetical protein [Deltaproteobacteria bacterium]
MKLLSVTLARSLWFGRTQDFNPRGVNLYPIITPLLVESYKFVTVPSAQEALDDSKGTTYASGEFINKDGVPVVVSLTIFPDALVADTRSSTKDSDDFLEEILTRFSAELKLPHYKDIITRKSYVSGLHVKTNKSLQSLNPALNEIAKYLTHNVSDEGTIYFEVGGIHFWPEQSTVPKPASFIFERILNVPFSEESYYSGAPLQTDNHLELLDKLERILSK